MFDIDSLLGMIDFDEIENKLFSPDTVDLGDSSYNESDIIHNESDIPLEQNESENPDSDNDQDSDDLGFDDFETCEEEFYDTNENEESDWEDYNHNECVVDNQVEKEYNTFDETENTKKDTEEQINVNHSKSEPSESLDESEEDLNSNEDPEEMYFDEEEMYFDEEETQINSKETQINSEETQNNIFSSDDEEEILLDEEDEEEILLGEDDDEEEILLGEDDDEEEILLSEDDEDLVTGKITEEESISDSNTVETDVINKTVCNIEQEKPETHTSDEHKSQKLIDLENQLKEAELTEKLLEIQLRNKRMREEISKIESEKLDSTVKIEPQTENIAVSNIKNTEKPIETNNIINTTVKETIVKKKSKRELEIDAFTKMEPEELMKYVKKFLAFKDVHKKLVDISEMQNRFGDINVKRLLKLGYIIRYGDKITAGM